MKKFKTLLGALVLVPTLANAGFYSSTIRHLQGEGLEDPYNSVRINLDVTDSPCSSTNSNDRFAISDPTQQSFALAALMANKEISIMSTGQCNAAGIETINYILIKP